MKELNVVELERDYSADDEPAVPVTPYHEPKEQSSYQDEIDKELPFGNRN